MQGLEPGRLPEVIREQNERVVRYFDRLLRTGFTGQSSSLSNEEHMTVFWFASLSPGDQTDVLNCCRVALRAPVAWEPEALKQMDNRAANYFAQLNKGDQKAVFRLIQLVARIDKKNPDWEIKE